jgi:hypothetical protein
MPEVNELKVTPAMTVHEHPTDTLDTAQWLEQRLKPAQGEQPSTTAEEPGTSPLEQDRDESGKFKTKEDQEDKVPVGVQKRIDKAVAKQRDAERRAEEAERKLQAINQGTQPEKTVAQPETSELKAPAEPKEEDFADWPTFRAAERKYFGELAEFTAKKLIADTDKKREENARKQKELESGKALADSFLESEAAVKARHKDYDEVIETLTEDIQAKKIPALSNPILAAIAESESKADLLYHIATNRDDLELLQKSPVHKIGYVLGKIEARLDIPETKPAPEPKPEVKAKPKPAEPVSRSASASSGPSEDDTPEEWAKKRYAQLHAKGKRY